MGNLTLRTVQGGRERECGKDVPSVKLSEL